MNNIFPFNLLTPETFTKVEPKINIEPSVELKDNKKKERKELLQKMFNSRQFNNKIYVFGFGAVARPLLFMLLKVVRMNPSNITVIDKIDKSDENEYFRKMGVHFVKKLIEKSSYLELLKDIKVGDIIIDCAYNINTKDMLSFCQERGCHYINSCIEFWDYKGVVDPIEYSLYYKQNELQALDDSYKQKKYNAIISMGCNPGNVSIWTKIGLMKINQKYKHPYKNFAELAQKLGVQVIHVSERDTQRTKDSKRVNEYCNTWSSDGEAFCEEALGCIEASWGTHEKTVPSDMLLLKDNFILLNRLCIYTYAQSVVPIYGRYFGYMIRHDEANTIGKNLEVKDVSGGIVYKPSVYYVYHPCDSAKISMEEIKERNFKYQKKWRLLTHEIEDGRDILGLTFYLENKEVYWIGSVLDVKEARELFDNMFDEWVNATNVQVVAGYLSGILHIMDLIDSGNNLGMMTPDDLPYKKMFNMMKPLLGEFLFTKIDDFKLIKYMKTFTGKNTETDEWQFENFIV